MRDNQFNIHEGARGSTKVDLTFAELYDIMRSRLEYLPGQFDPDAVCQNISVEIEKKMGIFPNIKERK